MKPIFAFVLPSIGLGLACSEGSTGPQSSASLAPPGAAVNALSYQPPPPFATSVDGSASSTLFSVSVTYFMNPPGNNGWISFAKEQPANVTLSSPSARISIRDGVASGKGSITIVGTTETLVINLENGITGGTFRTSCAGSCGSFTFNATSYRSKDGNGTPVSGSAYIRGTRGGDVAGY